MRIVLTAIGLGMLTLGQIAQADFVFGEPQKVPGINTTSNDGAVQISRDGLELYFTSNRDHGVDLCFADIWVCTRRSVSDPWGPPIRLDAPVNTDVAESHPCPSADGLELYFSDGWTGADGWTAHYHSCPRRPNGFGGADLWVTTRADRNDPWDEPVNLGELINTSYDEDQPSISADGLSLYFASNRPGGMGNADLYVSTRPTRMDPWSRPTLLSSTINVNWKWETNPFISADERSLFFSQGTSAIDVFVSRRADETEPWGTPQPFWPVNTSTKAEYCLSISQADSMIYFSRGDSVQSLPSFDIWQVSVRPVVDFNEDDVVDVLDALVLIENWGVIGGRAGGPQTTLCDIAPFPFGDGVVDAQDLSVLAQCMTENVEDINDIDG